MIALMSSSTITACCDDLAELTGTDIMAKSGCVYRVADADHLEEKL